MEQYDAHLSEDGTRRQSVAAHLNQTAALCAGFAAAFQAKELGETTGLLHDIGKYSDAFQARIHNPQHSAGVDHSTAGAQVAQALGLPPAAFAVAGHHAGLPDGGSPNDCADASTLLGRMRRTVADCSAWKTEITLPHPQLPAFCTRDPFTLAFFIRILYSCLVDADYLDTERFMQNGAPPRGGGVPLSLLQEKAHAKAAGWLNAPDQSEVAKKRCAILQTCLDQGRTCAPGLYTLTVPTGGGKTFASLSFALEHAIKAQKQRIVYVIPYTSIIDQTVDVFSEILGKENVLAHYAGSDYQLKERDTLSPLEYRRALAAENWDAPVVVTTAVQFFESLFAARSSRCRKLHNLAQSVIVFDEAQTLPVPYLRPCLAAIAQLVQHYGVTALLCTATQPALGPLLHTLAPELLLRELCPESAKLYTDFRRTTLRDLGRLTVPALAGRLCAHDQMLCVVNRRKLAQQLYEALPPEGRYCLTTLQCPADRRALLAEIRARLNKGLPCRVVSTSLIEAGVDVDFPVAYREQCGLDSFLQTAGRCNREGRHAAAESFVFLFSLEEERVPPFLAQNIAALGAAQRAAPELDSPAAIEAYFTALWAVKGPEALDQKGILNEFERGAQGRIFPFATVADQFHLIETPTTTVYLPIGNGAELCARLQSGERSRTLFRQLGAYSVNVYAKHFDALYRAGALAVIEEGSSVLTDLALYTQETGLSMEVKSGQALFG